jgi:hypothetical protein
MSTPYWHAIKRPSNSWIHRRYAMRCGNAPTCLRAR